MVMTGGHVFQTGASSTQGFWPLGLCCCLPWPRTARRLVRPWAVNARCGSRPRVLQRLSRQGAAGRRALLALTMQLLLGGAHARPVQRAPNEAAGQRAREGRDPVEQRVLRPGAAIVVVHKEGEGHGGVEAGAGVAAADDDLGFRQVARWDGCESSGMSGGFGCRPQGAGRGAGTWAQ
jgi:hypothetical protein